MKAFTTWCLLLFLLFLGAHTGALSPGSYLYYYTSAIDGSSQPYGLYLPSPFVPATPHPVIFIGHGFGGSATAYFNSAQMGFADANGCLLVQLQGRGNTFYDGVGEVDFFDVLNDLRAKYNIDLRRLYFEGASMGATGALSVGHPPSGCTRRSGWGRWLGGLSLLVYPMVRSGGRPLVCRAFPAAQSVDGLLRGCSGRQRAGRISISLPMLTIPPCPPSTVRT